MARARPRSGGESGFTGTTMRHDRLAFMPTVSSPSTRAAFVVATLAVIITCGAAMARYVSRAPQVPWRACVNQRFRYDLQYPPDYEILVTSSGTGTPELQPAQTCEGARYVVLRGPGENSFGIHVETQDDLTRTVYAGVTTLEELFARNPDLGDIDTLDHTQLGGAAAVRQSGQLLALHDGDLYTITQRLDNAAVRNGMLASFSFR
jgi:hypothetical protein